MFCNSQHAVRFALVLLVVCSSNRVAGEDLPVLYVTGQRVAITTPASTYATAVTALELDPRIDLQARNIGEAQGDVTLRGGIFENTGFRIGGVSLFDPQTGHYAAEIPIATEMLSLPEVATGADNALGGIGATVGTVDYQWTRMRSGGAITGGVGDHAANYERIHVAHVLSPEADAWRWGIEADLSRSVSDGTIRYGDHDFDRRNLRIQLQGPASQTDFFAGDQDKFFGWFGMYTGAAYKAYNPYETEQLHTRLYMLNHRQEYGGGSEWEIGASIRRNEDHYIFNRFAPNRAFVHDTRVSSFSARGNHVLGDAWSIAYLVELATDGIDSTTLEHSFTSRGYRKAGVVPRFVKHVAADQAIEARAGVTLDDTTRDERAWLPVAEIAWVRERGGVARRIYLSYAETSRVPGYTAIGGPATGLFASNAGLGRERSRNLEAGVRFTSGDWSAQAALFRRADRDLADWTFSFASSNARTANAVDIDVTGAETIATYQWSAFEVLASYTWLHKSEEYGSAAVDASFYALNYARHRVTFAAIWYPSAWAEVRLDNEWRAQQPNAIREGSASALYSHLLVTLSNPRHEAWKFTLAGDNLWDDRFEEVPGTPGRGRQVTAAVSWSW